jgi:hypothetical protein
MPSRGQINGEDKKSLVNWDSVVRAQDEWRRASRWGCCHGRAVESQIHCLSQWWTYEGEASTKAALLVELVVCPDVEGMNVSEPRSEAPAVDVKGFRDVMPLPDEEVEPRSVGMMPLDPREVLKDIDSRDDAEDVVLFELNIGFCVKSCP